MKSVCFFLSNTKGKSTVLRSVCSIALLATCGFLVPAKEASVPFVDYIMLRTFSSDSPAEGKSGFAVEMHEMRSVLEVRAGWKRK